MPSRSAPVPLSSHKDATTLRQIGIHPQQPPQENTLTPTVFMHQSVGDGSRRLLQWLDSSPQ
eukprot:12683398-Heterocapsa_arctica.AAC.1